MSLPTCPKGCSSPFYLTTVVQHESSCGINEFQCMQCKFKWDVEDEISPAFSKRKQRGGARDGAGRPTKHGQKTVIKRVPESLASEIDMLVTGLPELRELLANLEADCENNSSPRYHFLRQALQEIRSIGF